MAAIIELRVRMGLEADLPILVPGEFGFCTDSAKLFIGTGETNIAIAKLSDVSTAHDSKVDKTTTIIGLDLQNDIELVEFKENLGNASATETGLMTSNMYQQLQELYLLLGAVDDADSFVNTLYEILDVFSTYPEGIDILALISSKVTAVPGKGLSTNDYTDNDKDKLDTVEEGATADQTDEEIKEAYENNPDTNEYTDAEKAKLATVEAGATKNSMELHVSEPSIEEVGINNIYFMLK